MKREAERYAVVFVEWLRELGYTHCFFVAGGNVMHLLDAARTRLECVPFVHEVAAGVAAEYFNEMGTGARAFALVTAGPGVTNVITALAGAYLESRELLVVGGQVKSTDLASDGLRQRGIQEIDGIGLARPVTKAVLQIRRPVARRAVVDTIMSGRTGRKGPVFVDFCLDAQGATVSTPSDLQGIVPAIAARDGETQAFAEGVLEIGDRLTRALRPVLLLGGGVSRGVVPGLLPRLRQLAIPVMTTWNGADRIGADEAFYFGRPNTWGQRYANILLQQADLVIALGTRLGLQQTGFNWRAFVPQGSVVQVDLDRRELEKGHPHVEVPLCADADDVLRALVAGDYPSYAPWSAFCEDVRRRLPLSEAVNVTAEGFVSPYAFYEVLSEMTGVDDTIVPCSSGAANSVAMQALSQKTGQIIITNKGLASMGYGLSGAIGAALAAPERRTIVIEGDGGFMQNAQELGTVAIQQPNLKIFIFDNQGYASIRATQRNHFGGAYIGCDATTGLGLPRWEALFAAFAIPVSRLRTGFRDDPEFVQSFADDGPCAYIVPVDPEQTYFPKITSRVGESGDMESRPLHYMTPDLSPELERTVMPYLPQVSVPV